MIKKVPEGRAYRHLGALILYPNKISNYVYPITVIADFLSIKSQFFFKSSLNGLWAHAGAYFDPKNIQPRSPYFSDS